MAKRLLSHLAHVELLTPKLDQSVEFFKETMSLTESDADLEPSFTSIKNPWASRG